MQIKNRSNKPSRLQKTIQSAGGKGVLRISIPKQVLRLLNLHSGDIIEVYIKKVEEGKQKGISITEF